MLAAVAAVWALLLGAALIMVGNGLLVTVLGVRAKLEGFPDAVSGLVMSGYYVGFLAGSFLVPKAIQRVGHVRVYAALASLVAAAALVHAIFVTPSVWGLMRMVAGFSYAGLYVIGESWLNDRAANEMRGKLLSVYMVIQFAGVAVGQLLLNLADPLGFELFSLVAILLALAVPTMLLTASRAPAFESPAKMGLARLFAISPLGVLGCFGVGIAHSAFFGMGAVYAKSTGLSVAQVANFMTAAVIGGVVAQWPVGHLSDRVDRRVIIVVAACIAASAAVAALLLPDRLPQGTRTGALLGLVFVLGAATLPLYSLVVAHTNDFLKPPEMVAASGSLMLVFGIGAIAGPAVVGVAMSTIGPVGFFLYLAAAHGLIALIALFRMTRRAPPPAEARTPYQPVAPTAPLAERD
jgi:MFS family permease